MKYHYVLWKHILLLYINLTAITSPHQILQHLAVGFLTAPYIYAVGVPSSEIVFYMHVKLDNHHSLATH